MAKLVIEIDSTDSIAQLNSKVMFPTKALEGVIALRNYLDAMLAGCVDASAQVTSRDTTASVSTSGSGSQQVTYNLK